MKPDSAGSAASGAPASAAGEAKAEWGRPRWILGAVVAAVVLALLLLFGYGLIRASQSGGIGINAIGEVGRIPPGPAPEIAMPLYNGGIFRLSDQRGKVVVVNFWASWCIPCRDEAPALERAARDYRDRGIVFAGVDIWDSEKDARDFLQRFGVSYPNGPDRTTAAIEYGLTGVPETYFIALDGTIARHWIGPLDDAQIHALVDELLR